MLSTYAYRSQYRNGLLGFHLLLEQNKSKVTHFPVDFIYHFHGPNGSLYVVNFLFQFKELSAAVDQWISD